MMVSILREGVGKHDVASQKLGFRERYLKLCSSLSWTVSGIRIHACYGDVRDDLEIAMGK